MLTGLSAGNIAKAGILKPFNSPIPLPAAGRQPFPKIGNGAGSEEEIDLWVREFISNVPDPKAVDLIFWSELSPEMVVEKALSYKPKIIQIPKKD